MDNAEPAVWDNDIPWRGASTDEYRRVEVAAEPATDEAAEPPSQDTGATDPWPHAPLLDTGLGTIMPPDGGGFAGPPRAAPKPVVNPWSRYRPPRRLLTAGAAVLLTVVATGVVFALANTRPRSAAATRNATAAPGDTAIKAGNIPDDAVADPTPTSTDVMTANNGAPDPPGGGPPAAPDIPGSANHGAGHPTNPPGQNATAGSVPRQPTTKAAAQQAPKTTGPAQPAGPTGRISGYNGECVHVANTSSVDGTQVEMYTCNTGAGEVWTLTSDGTIRALGKCLDVDGGATSDGTRVQLWTCDGGANQQWKFTSGRDLVNPKADKCLDVKDMNTNIGAALQIWTCGGTSNQKWAVP